MNTLCKICGHVELQGHHKCDPEGDSVRVSVTTPGVLRMDMLEHHGRTPSSPETVVKVSRKPFDSIGRRYYATRAEIRDAVTILKRNSVDYRTLDGRPVYVIPMPGEGRTL